MPSTAKTAPASRAAATAKQAPARDAQAILDVLERQGTKAGRDAMARYAIPSDRAFGVPVGALLWSLTVHDPDAADARFIKGLTPTTGSRRDDTLRS